MCLAPIRIRNKGLLHNAGPYNLQVPCGHCKDCQDVKSIDYFLRAFSIYRNLPAGWQMYFVTFTYRESDCPRSDFYDINPKTGEYYKVFRNCRVFNHDHLHTFVKSYVQKYRRLYPNDPEKRPKMLFTCEFGETEGATHRPHYHGLIAVPYEFVTYKEFKDEIESFWHYGFTKDIRIHKFDKSFPEDRDPINCIKYICKYVTKGTGFYPKYLKEKHLIPSLAERFKIEPRVFTTNGFGKELENLLTNANYVSNAITLCVGKTFQQYNIPAYYRRRYFTKTIIDSLEVYYKDEKTYPFRTESRKRAVKKQSHCEYINGFDELRKTNLVKSLRSQFFQARSAFINPSDDFNIYLCNHVDKYSIYLDAIRNLLPTNFADWFLEFYWSPTPVYNDRQMNVITTEKAIQRYEHFQNAYIALEIYHDFLREQKFKLRSKQSEDELQFYRSCI